MRWLERLVGRPTITRRLLFWFLVVALVPLMATHVIGYFLTERYLQRSILTHLTAMAEDKASQLEWQVRERERNLRVLTLYPQVIETTRQLDAALGNGGPRTREYAAAARSTLALLDPVHQHQAAPEMFLVSPTGTVLFTIHSPSLVGTRLGDASSLGPGPYQAFDGARTFLQVEMSNFEPAKGQTDPVAYFAAPIVKDGTLVGVLVVQFDTQEIFDILGDHTGLGETGETVVGQEVGEDLLVMAPLRHDPEAAFRRKIPPGTEADLPMRKAVMGEAGSGPAVDYRGVRILGAWRYLPSFRWGLVVKMDQAEALALVGQQHRQMFMALGLATVAVVGLALFVAVSFSRPLLALREAADALRTGHFGAESDLHPDKLGGGQTQPVQSRDELGDLSQAFGEMAEQLRKSYAALASTERRFRGMVENSLGGMGLLDAQATIRYASPASLRILGLTPEELQGRGAFELMHPDDIPRVQPLLQRLLAKPSETIATEFRYHYRLGSWRWLHVVGVNRLADPDVQAVIVHFLDVTAEKEVEAALRESEARHRTLVNAIPDLLFRLDREGRFIDYKAESSESLLAPPEEWLGKHYRTILPAHVSDGVATAIATAIANRSVERFDYDLTSPDGARHWFEARVAATSEGHTVVLVRNITERKLTEEALRESQARYERAVNGANDGIWEWNPTTGENYLSPRWKQLLGYEDHELPNVQASFFDRIHPEDQARVAEAIRAHFEERKPYEIESRLRCKNGAYRWFVARGLATWDDRGRPVLMSGSISDITERKEAETALRESERRLGYALEATTEGIWDWNLRTGQVLFSPSWLRSLGFASGELPPHVSSWEKLVHPDDMPRMRKALQDHFERRTAVYQCENRLRTKSGTYRWNLDRGKVVEWDAAGQPLRMVGSDTDISERKKADEALAASEQRLRAIIEAEPECVKVIAADGTLVEMNPAGLAILECGSLAEAVEQPLGEFLVPEYRTAFQALRQRVMRGETGTLEFEAVGRRGTRRWLDTHAVPLRDDTGRVTALLGITRDITQRKQAEEALRQLNAELEHRVRERTAELAQAKEAAEAANRAKSEFLANMSHEIRTPMNGVLGMTGLALETELTAEQRQYLEAVRESGEALLRLLNDILDFSKIEAGRLDFEDVDFSLDETIGMALKTLAVRAHQKGLELTYHVASDAPDGLVGDPGRLRQVLTNLAGNAIKFTERGEVVVTVTVEAQTTEEVVLHVAVRDTGIGIAADRQQIIFEPFTQADGSTTRRYGGTGLGLTISTRLVGHMGGRIWLESELGQGSTFHFTVRFRRSSAMPAQQYPAPPIKLSGLPVLVVDDNAANRLILERLLAHWQMQPTVVDHGAAALAALAKADHGGDPFGLVLVDYLMPEMDGFMLVERMRRQPALAGVAVLMLTSAVQPGHAARCSAEGIAACLVKPVRPAELLDAITRALRISWYRGKETAPAAAAPKPAPFPCLRILLAEDNLINQKVAMHWLTNLGHAVVVVGNGREALEALERDRFDLVLMDVQMPEMDGFEATAVVRAREQGTGRHLPIIALTAHAMAGDRDRCLAAGMDGYIAKPVQPEELQLALANLTGVQEGSRNAAPPADPRPGQPACGAEPPIRLGASEAKADPPVLDRAALLARVGDNLELVGRLLEIFRTSYPGMLQSIREALGRGDAVGLSRAAHTLKGSLGSLGAKRAFQAAKALEESAHAGDLTHAGDSLQRLEIEVERVPVELARLVQEGRPCES